MPHALVGLPRLRDQGPAAQARIANGDRLKAVEWWSEWQNVNKMPSELAQSKASKVVRTGRYGLPESGRKTKSALVGVDAPFWVRLLADVGSGEPVPPDPLLDGEVAQ